MNKTYRKATFFFFVICSSNMFQNSMTKRPKMRCRTLGKWPWEHIEYFEASCWSPRHPQKVFSCSLGPRLEAVWTLFGSSPSLFRYHLKNILGYQTRRSQFAFRSWLLISCSSRHTLAIFVHPRGRGQGSPLTHPSWWPCSYNLHLPDSTTDVHIQTHINTECIIPKNHPMSQMNNASM